MVAIELVNGQRMQIHGPTFEEVLTALRNASSGDLVLFQTTTARESVNPAHVVRVIEQ